MKVEKREADDTQLDVSAGETSNTEEGPKTKVLKLEIEQVDEDDIFIDYEELVDPEEGYEESEVDNCVDATEAVGLEDEDALVEDNDSEGGDGQDPDDDDYVFEGDEEDDDDIDENSMNCDSEDKGDYGESKESDPLDTPGKAKVYFISKYFSLLNCFFSEG